MVSTSDNIRLKNGCIATLCQGYIELLLQLRVYLNRITVSVMDSKDSAGDEIDRVNGD